MGFANKSDFFYFSSHTIIPFIICISVYFNAYKISYVPLSFIYLVDLIWILGANNIKHYSYLNFFYAILITLGLVLVYKALSYVKIFQNKIDLEAQEKLDLIQKELDRLEAEESDE